MAEQEVVQTIIKGTERIALNHMGIKRFDIQQMRAIAWNTKESIVQRIHDGRSIPTFLRAPTEEETSSINGQTIVLEIGGTNMRAALIKVKNGKPMVIGGRID